MTSTKLATTKDTTTAIAPMAFLDEGTLRFFAQMIEKANLVPYDAHMNEEAQRARVMAKIVGGSAHGFDPISSQTFLHVVNNRLELSASGISCKIKESGVFDYRIDKLDDDGCQLTALVLVEKDGARVWVALPPPVAFTREMADSIEVYDGSDLKKLGDKQTYKAWGPDMFFARCATRLAKRFFPQVLRGSAWSNPAADFAPVVQPEHPSQPSQDEIDAVAPIGSTPPVFDTPEEQQEFLQPDEEMELKAVRALIIDYCKELEMPLPDSPTLDEANKVLSRLVDLSSKKEEETKKE